MTSPSSSGSHLNRRIAKEGQKLCQTLTLQKDGIWVDPESVNRTFTVEQARAFERSKAEQKFQIIQEAYNLQEIYGPGQQQDAQYDPPQPYQQVFNGPIIQANSPDLIAVWNAYIQGPLTSIWRSGVFRVEIKLYQGYPMIAPKVRFKDPLFHPNVCERSGEICSRVLTDGWSPAFSIENILHFMRSVLVDPNWSSTDIQEIQEWQQYWLEESQNENGELEAVGHEQIGLSNLNNINLDFDNFDDLMREQQMLYSNDIEAIPSKLYHYTTKKAMDQIIQTKVLKPSHKGARGVGIYTTCLHPTNRTKEQIKQNNHCKGCDYVIEFDTTILRRDEGHLIGKCNKGYREYGSGDHYLITKGQGSLEKAQMEYPIQPGPNNNTQTVTPYQQQQLQQQYAIETVCIGRQIPEIPMDIHLKPGVNCEISTFEDACTCVKNKKAFELFLTGVENGEYRMRVRESIAKYGGWLQELNRKIKKSKQLQRRAEYLGPVTKIVDTGEIILPKYTSDSTCSTRTGSNVQSSAESSNSSSSEAENHDVNINNHGFQKFHYLQQLSITENGNVQDSNNSSGSDSESEPRYVPLPEELLHIESAQPEVTCHWLKDFYLLQDTLYLYRDSRFDNELVPLDSLSESDWEVPPVNIQVQEDTGSADNQMMCPKSRVRQICESQWNLMKEELQEHPFWYKPGKRQNKRPRQNDYSQEDWHNSMNNSSLNDRYNDVFHSHNDTSSSSASGAKSQVQYNLDDDQSGLNNNTNDSSLKFKLNGNTNSDQVYNLSKSPTDTQQVNDSESAATESDQDLERAIQLSMQQSIEDEKRRKQFLNQATDQSDDENDSDLQEALKLSIAEQRQVEQVKDDNRQTRSVKDGQVRSAEDSNSTHTNRRTNNNQTQSHSNNNRPISSRGNRSGSSKPDRYSDESHSIDRASSNHNDDLSQYSRRRSKSVNDNSSNGSGPGPRASSSWSNSNSDREMMNSQDGRDDDNGHSDSLSSDEEEGLCRKDRRRKRQ